MPVPSHRGGSFQKVRVEQLSRCSLVLLLPLGVPPAPAPAMLHTKSFPASVTHQRCAVCSGSLPFREGKILEGEKTDVDKLIAGGSHYSPTKLPKLNVTTEKGYQTIVLVLVISHSGSDPEKDAKQLSETHPPPVHVVASWEGAA